MTKRSILSKRVGLAFLTIALCLGVGVGTALAYYSDTTNAEGTLLVSFDDPKTEITEEGDGANKDITITSASDVPVLVRVKLLFAQHNATVQLRGDDWATIGDDGWLYYTKPLYNNGDAASVLKAIVTVSDDATDKFNLVVDSQAAAVYWDATDDGSTEGYAAKFLGHVKNMANATPLPADGYTVTGFAPASSVEGTEGE